MNRIIATGFLFASLFSFRANAATAPSTYYIDCAAGADANAGTSTSAPWLHHPYMSGFSGRYTHHAGDQFYFKGGVTCPNSYFPMTLGAGGTVAVSGYGGSCSATDYYGPDPTKSWYTGSSWARPIWDFQNEVISGNNIAVDYNSDAPSCITMDNFEIRGFYWDDNASSYGYTHRLIFNFHNSTSQLLLWDHIYIHGWSHAAYNSGAVPDDATWWYGPNWSHDQGVSFGPGELNNVIQNSVVMCPVGDGNCHSNDSAPCSNGSAGPCKDGDAVFGGIYDLHSCWIQDVSEAIVGAVYTVHDSYLQALGSYDPTQHPNVVETWAVDSHEADYYNLVIGNIDNTFVMDIRSANYNGAETINIFNNTLYNIGTQDPIGLDARCNGGITCRPDLATVNVFNNSVGGEASATGVCLGLDGEPDGNNWGAVTSENNHCITTSGSSIGFWIGVTPYSQPNPSTPLLVQTPIVADADSSPHFDQYTTSQTYVYSPVASTNSTVGAGTNLVSLCNAMANVTAQAACKLDTTYAVIEDANHNAVPSGRTPNPRPSGITAWDAGAYQYTTGGGGGQPNPPTSLSAIVN